MAVVLSLQYVYKYVTMCDNNILCMCVRMCNTAYVSVYVLSYQNMDSCKHFVYVYARSHDVTVHMCPSYEVNSECVSDTR